MFSNKTHGIKTEPMNHYHRCSSDLEVYQCPNCNFLTNAQVSLSIHSHTHNAQTSINIDYKQVLKSYECENYQCSCQTYSKLLLLKHHSQCKKPQLEEIIAWLSPSLMPKPRNRPKPTLITCDFCPYTASVAPNLKRHIEEKHMTFDQIPWFKCHQCPYMTKRKHSLKTHMVYKHIDENVKWYHCEHCSYKSKIKDCVKKHQIRHTSNEDLTWYQCEHCEFKSKFSSALRRHIMTSRKHEQIRGLYAMSSRVGYKKLRADVAAGTWDCDRCAYKTSRSNQLRRHKARDHLIGPEVVVKWFDCQVCSFMTKYKEGLRRHMMRHATSVDQIEWFCCEFCPFKTKFKSSLERHNLTKHHQLMHEPFRKHFLAM